MRYNPTGSLDAIFTVRASPSPTENFHLSAFKRFKPWTIFTFFTAAPLGGPFYDHNHDYYADWILN